MKIDYNLRDKFDLGLILSALALVCIGLAAIYSSTVNHPTMHGNFQRQLIWGIGSVVVFLVTYSLPTNSFKTIAIPSYLISLFFLVVVLIVGRKVSGAKSWLDLGAFGFQPSELAKIGTILALASYLSGRNMNIDSFKDIFLALVIGFIPVGLILLEPDMGTTFVFLALIMSMLFWRGLSLFWMFVVLSPGLIAVSSLFGIYYFISAVILIIAGLFYFKRDLIFSGSILAINLAAGFFTDYMYTALSPHQQKRIQAFIDPMSDPLGSGYNSIQAKVAIGSGGFWGKGFLAGNQTQLQFIPEQWTDFIYCVIGEEFGFIGSFTVLALFLYIFLRIIKTVSTSKDEFISLTLIGILSVYLGHFIINIGMTVGLLPVIGIPLPFVSYGGSSLMVNMFLLGIIANVYRTRKNYT